LDEGAEIMGEIENKSTNELGEIRKKIEEHEKRISDLENLGKENAQQLKKFSPKEFILQKKPRDDLQKTLVLGYYLEHHRAISPFTAKDLEKTFGEAKEPVPKNINDNVNKNIGKAFMMDAESKKDKKKAWTLTGTGERFVENGLKEED
jgi:hypothetical protein